MTAALLEARDLVKTYTSRKGLFAQPVTVRAVDGLSLSVAPATTLGIVGESGSGKSTTGRLLLGLEDPSEGDVTFEGSALPRQKTPSWRALRARMQLVYQDPLAALDRRLSIGRQIAEPLEIHGIGTPDEQKARVVELMRAVGLRPDQASRYPHELSGGQRQRVVIARAIASKPRLIVCDEPVSALDVSIQAQVVNLLRDLQEREGIAMVFISHDLKVVRNISDRVAVMYLGRIVEEASSDEIFAKPLHPYTQALVSSVPVAGTPLSDRIILQGSHRTLPRDRVAAPFIPAAVLPLRAAAARHLNFSPCPRGARWPAILQGPFRRTLFMLRFLMVRGFRAFVTILLVVTFAFVVLRMSGDPAQIIMGPDAPPEAIAAFRKNWGLDDPLWQQYLRYFGAIARGDLGISMRDGQSAIALVAERIPATLQLTIPALLIKLGLGIPAGIYAALHRNSFIDRAVMATAVIGFTLPSFVLGLLLVLVFSVSLGWLPSGGQDSWMHAILPIITMGLGGAAILARFSRSAMIEILGQPYIRTASAKGVSWRDVVWRHALPNAAIPIVTIVGFMVGSLIAGAVVVESLFSWPGVGRLLVVSVANRDLAIVQCILLLVAATMVISNFVVDLLYGYLDPRLRQAQGKA